jgi:hypothetical protein
MTLQPKITNKQVIFVFFHFLGQLFRSSSAFSQAVEAFELAAKMHAQLQS